MSFKGQIIIVIISVLFIVLVIELLRRRKIREEYCLWWLSIAAFTIFITLNQRLLQRITHLIGALFPVSTLTLFSLAFIVAMLIYFSMQVSLLSRQVKELTQSVALLKKELNEKI